MLEHEAIEKIKEKERRWGMWEQGTHTLMVTV